MPTLYLRFLETILTDLQGDINLSGMTSPHKRVSKQCKQVSFSAMDNMADFIDRGLFRLEYS
jgi:hypothetical protein